MDKTNPVTVTKSKENVKVKIRVGDKEVKQVVVYLGSTIHDEGNSEKEIIIGIEKEIIIGIGIAKKAFGSMTQILKNLSMSMKVRIRILKYFVWLKLLYGCEKRSIKTDLREKIDATEMWF